MICLIGHPFNFLIIGQPFNHKVIPSFFMEPKCFYFLMKLSDLFISGCLWQVLGKKWVVERKLTDE